MARVLVIGDTHAPFMANGYIDHLKRVYKEHKCDHVVHIGDVIDSHYSSFHATNPDGHGGGDELEIAIEQVSKIYKAFPNADIILGNHDRIVNTQGKDGESTWQMDKRL